MSPWLLRAPAVLFAVMALINAVNAAVSKVWQFWAIAGALATWSVLLVMLERHWTTDGSFAFKRDKPAIILGVAMLVCVAAAAYAGWSMGPFGRQR